MGPCALSELPNFRVTNAFPPNVMHDFLEGVFEIGFKRPCTTKKL